MLQFIRLVRLHSGYSQPKNRHFYRTYGLYLCHCGKEVLIRTGKEAGRSSCGCMCGGKTHGLTKSGLYLTWAGMIRRCHSPTNPAYNRYGGRGIHVCTQWRQSFAEFHKWAMENGWEKGLTIERVNNDLGYMPSNCKFIIRARQARNRHTNKLTMEQVKQIRTAYDAGLMTNCELAVMYKITPTTMCKIVHRKIWKEDDAS